MPLRVLIVEDSPVTRMIITDMMELIGHKVVAEAEGMDQALKAFEQHKPDLITLDISLTDNNGLNVLKAIREKNPQVKVLVISGNSQKKVHEQIAAAGAGFLGKPFNLEELTAAVSALAAAK